MQPSKWTEWAVFRVGGVLCALDAFALTEVVPCRRGGPVLELGLMEAGSAPAGTLRWRDQAVPAWSASALAGKPGAQEAVALVMARGDQRAALMVESFEGVRWLENSSPESHLRMGVLGARAMLDEGAERVLAVDAQELLQRLMEPDVLSSNDLDGKMVMAIGGALWARQAICQAALARGARALEAAHASGALEELERRGGAVDVALIDEDFQECHGDSWEELRERLGAARLAFYSSRRGRANADMAKRQGAVAVEGTGAMALKCAVES